MSRIKLLLQVTEDVQALADSLRELVDAMQQGEPDVTTEAMTEPEVTSEEMQVKAKQPTLEEVRGLLARKSQAGKSAEVKSLIEKHGASRLSDIKPEQYLALMADAEGL